MIKAFRSNQFLFGSFTMVLGMNLYNVGQFVYHFLSGRFLGKAQYGELATVITILGFFAIVQMALGLTLVKFIADSSDKKEQSNFIKWIFYLSLWIGLFLGLIFMILSPFLAKFLNFSNVSILIILGPILFFFLLATVVRSALQGLMRFEQYIISFLTESISKIILTVILILLGYAVFGAMVGLLLGIIFSFIVGYFYLNKYLIGKRSQSPDFGKIFRYSTATLIQGLALTSMYSMDLILVKHFFPSENTGIYASLAILGRVIFFGASPITHVMFPIVAKRRKENKNYFQVFYMSLFLIGCFSALVTLFYFLWPNFAIGILFGSEFLEGAPLLWFYGLFMSLLAIAMLLTQFYLSIGKTKIVLAFVFAALLQIILITFFHPDLFGVIKMSILSVALLDLILFVYLPMLKDEKTAFGSRSGLQTRADY